MICRICENQFLPLQIFPSWHLLYTKKHVLVQCTYFAVRRWEGIGMINSTYRHRTKGKKVQTSELKKCWMVLEAHALYSEGTKMTCCSFLAVSDQSYNCTEYFLLFFRLQYILFFRDSVTCPSPLWVQRFQLSPSTSKQPNYLKKRIHRNRICYSSSAQCFLFSLYLVLKSKFYAVQQFRLL